MANKWTRPYKMMFRADNRCHYHHGEMTMASLQEPNSATREHIVPDSLGGLMNPANIVLACRDCNTKRGNGPSNCGCLKCKRAWMWHLMHVNTVLFDDIQEHETCHCHRERDFTTDRTSRGDTLPGDDLHHCSPEAGEAFDRLVEADMVSKSTQGVRREVRALVATPHNPLGTWTKVYRSRAHARKNDQWLKASYPVLKWQAREVIVKSWQDEEVDA
jgi:hypothetical protein